MSVISYILGGLFTLFYIIGIINEIGVMIEHCAQFYNSCGLSDYIILPLVPLLIIGILFIYLGYRKFKNYRHKYIAMIFLVALFFPTFPALMEGAPSSRGAGDVGDVVVFGVFLGIAVLVIALGSIIYLFLPDYTKKKKGENKNGINRIEEK